MPNRVATMVQNPAFDAFFGFVVITNAVLIGTWVKNQDVLSFSPNSWTNKTCDHG